MILICDDYNEVYIWVDDNDHDHELSPHFDYKEDAHAWRERIRQEVTK